MKVRYDETSGKLGKVYPDSMIIPQPYITLTVEEINDIENQKDKVAFVVDGRVIFRDKAAIDAEAKRAAEAERIAKLHMTKYDFFKYVCEPYGITYDALMAVVNSNDSIKAAWNLCNHVYRGNADLNAYILTVIPTLTEEKLNEIFEEHTES